MATGERKKEEEEKGERGSGRALVKKGV